MQIIFHNFVTGLFIKRNCSCTAHDVVVV